VCRLFVDRDGRVDAVELVESSGHAELDETALATLRRWRFEPLGDATNARRVRVLQRFTFQIERRRS
jgi:protein TonB